MTGAQNNHYNLMKHSQYTMREEPPVETPSRQDLEETLALVDLLYAVMSKLPAS